MKRTWIALYLSLLAGSALAGPITLVSVTNSISVSGSLELVDYQVDPPAVRYNGSYSDSINTTSTNPSFSNSVTGQVPAADFLSDGSYAHADQITSINSSTISFAGNLSAIALTPNALDSATAYASSLFSVDFIVTVPTVFNFSGFQGTDHFSAGTFSYSLKSSSGTVMIPFELPDFEYVPTYEFRRISNFSFTGIIPPGTYNFTATHNIAHETTPALGLERGNLEDYQYFHASTLTFREVPDIGATFYMLAIALLTMAPRIRRTCTR